MTRFLFFSFFFLFVIFTSIRRCRRTLKIYIPIYIVECISGHEVYRAVFIDWSGEGLVFLWREIFAAFRIFGIFFCVLFLWCCFVSFYLFIFFVFPFDQLMMEIICYHSIEIYYKRCLKIIEIDQEKSRSNLLVVLLKKNCARNEDFPIFQETWQKLKQSFFF